MRTKGTVARSVAVEAKTSGRPPGAEPRSSLVKIFAALGAISATVGLQAQVRWILSSDFTPSPRGPDEISDVRLVLLRVFEFGSAAVALWVLWRFLLKPWIRERSLTFDGMIVIAGFLNWWMDPLGNYFNYTVAYNAYGINMGSWMGFVPGVVAPNQHLLPESAIGVSSAWIWWVFGSAVLGCAFLRRVEARYPGTTLAGRLTACFGLFAVLDLVFEAGLIYVFQVWTYPGTVHALTLFPGHWYQFPLYQPILIGVLGVGVTALRYCRDDHGHSFVERGIDQLRVGEKTKKFISLLAVIGWLQVAISIVGFSIPYSFMAIKADTFPALPSYLRAGICGDGTAYACPSKEWIPIPSRSSLHIEPDDPRLPPSIRDRQGLNLRR